MAGDRRHRALLLLALLPLLLLNNRPSHNWGGDFAQYLRQAANLVEGRPQAETTYVYDEAHPSLPAPYPVGFPVLLAPTVAMFGLDALALSTTMSVFWIAVVLLAFVWFRTALPPLAAGLLALYLAYNPRMVAFKASVLSDIPFAAVSLVALLAARRLEKAGPWRAAALGAVGAFGMAIRSIGVVIPLALGSRLLWLASMDLREGRSPRPRLVALATLALVCALSHVGVTYAAFGFERSGPSYASFVDLSGLVQATATNAAYYARQLADFFVPRRLGWGAAGSVAVAIVLPVAVGGFLRRCRQGPDVAEFLTAGTLVAVLAFPHLLQGLRYLMPLLPLLLYYAAVGLQGIATLPRVPGAAVVGAAALLVLAPVPAGLSRHLRASDAPRRGPQEAASQEAFRVVAERVPGDAVIAFVKPRVLALYSGARAWSNRLDETPAGLAVRIEAFDVRYVLLHRDLPNPPLEAYLRRRRGATLRVWSNEKFRLLRLAERPEG